MDWRAQAYERLRSEESFKGKSRPEPKKSPCRVLSFFGDTTISNEELLEWLEGLEGTETRDTEPEETEPEDTEAQEIKAGEIELQSHQDGFRLLLCGRPESANSRANFFNIPVKKNISKDASHRGDPTARDDPAKGAHKEYDIRDILKRFPAHVHMGQVIKTTYPLLFSGGNAQIDQRQDTFSDSFIPYLNLIVALFPTDPRRIVYTAIFDTGLEGFKENLAFTSTYFPSNKTSFGIILGCTEQDVRKATALLDECGSSRNHQLLLPAVFFELQRHRLKDIRKSHTKDAIELQDNFEELRDFKNGRRAFEFRYQPLAVSECANRLSKLCTDSNVMAEDLRIASRQLNTLKRHAENLAEIQDKELKKPKKVKESPGAEPSNNNESSNDKPLSVEPPTDEQMKSALDNTRCFLDLFNEIAEDVELVSGAVTVNAKAATVTADEVTSTPPTSRPQE
ncbi:hypothetical protein CEP52_016626 [Fusarium oligoseptatum]|uniref:Uncharacterized protein n=1 Tax=Fusarium oligoseptatum TaxID=2604345 RepID=A0A428S1R6_9HYPO|nr:hypothetical protein CEP52_016626 [Fusarium oligoseptatum]